MTNDFKKFRKKYLVDPNYTLRKNSLILHSDTTTVFDTLVFYANKNYKLKNYPKCGKFNFVKMMNEKNRKFTCGIKKICDYKFLMTDIDCEEEFDFFKI